MISTDIGLPLATTQDEINAHETLVYNPDGGYTWVRQARNDEPTWPCNIGNWHTRAHTVGESLQAARNAGFNPTAVYYPIRRPNEV